jgi:hypothetical protein
MPNAMAQLMVGPLFQRGIGEDVLGNLFSSKDLLRSKSRLKAKKGEP